MVACKNVLWLFLPYLTMMNKKEMVLALLDYYEQGRDVSTTRSVNWEILRRCRQGLGLVPPVPQGASPCPSAAFRLLGRGQARGL